MSPKTTWILWKREMGALLVSPIAYVVAFFFLLAMAFSWVFAVLVLNGQPAEYTVMQVFFGVFFTWIALVVLMPVLGMRSFAEEYRQGTFEGLMTAPVRDWDVVLSKYGAVLGFYLLLWLPTLLFLALLRLVSREPVPVAWGAVGAGYLMVLLVGMLYAAIGILASSLTRNQVIAAVVAFCTTLVLFAFGFVNYFNPPAWLRDVLSVMGTYEHMEQCAKGMLSSRVPVFYVSATALLLLATQKVVESRRWRA